MADPLKIKVESPSPTVRSEMTACPTWSCDVGAFDWYYDQSETCLLLAGEVEVTTADGERVRFGAGDLVTFPQGLKCRWDVRQPVRKHYRFG